MEKIKNKKLYLLDLDGTIYLGDKIFKGSKEFLDEITRRGSEYVFLTNNSSRSGKVYVKKLKKMGINIKEENIMTSGKATILYINSIKENAKVFLLGTPSLEKEFTESGIQLVKDREEKPDFVVFGFDKTLTYNKMWMACDFILEGATYIATHPDINCPLPGGKFMIDTGAFLKAIEASIGKMPDIIIGKPSKFIIDIIKNEYNIDYKDMVMFGDRLYTDILGANNAGIDSVLVFSGETTKETYNKSKIKADFVLNSVRDLF